MKSLRFILLLLFGFTAAWVQAQTGVCSGTSTSAAEGTFIDGFTYEISTNGDVVTVEVELLDPKEGLVAFAQTYNPDFAEMMMTNIGGQAFSATFAGQADGAAFNVAVKFAFAGGLVTSTIIQYTVGEGCAGGTGGSIALPITFEDTELDYELVDFGGNASQIITDPTDAGNLVVESVKGGAAELWAGTTVADISGFAEPLPFGPGATTMTVRVWSPTAGIPVRLKVEQVGVPTVSVETEATTTLAAEWETLTFNFANQAGGTAPINFANTYNKASIFFNFGTTGADAGEQTYYWDDVTFGDGGGGSGSITLPITFEDTELDYELVDFGGNASQIITDPTDAGNLVVESVKGGAAELWAGTTVADISGFSEPLPFADGATTMTVRVWSPTAGTPIRLKVEQVGVPTISVETEATTTVAAEWETLTFDFANQAGGTAPINFANTYNKASIFFNFGTTGADAGEQTYYWDDVTFGGGGGGTGSITLPITFEDTELDYELVDFGGNASQIITDPTDAGNLVVESVKTGGAEVWAGTTVADVSGFSEPLPFADGATTMTVRVWSLTAGIPVRLKVEEVGNPAISVETEALTTLAGEWETLTFDFANQAEGTAPINFANTYNKASIFFNFGTSGADAGEQIYYWDDVTFGGGVNPAEGLDLPVTFEEEIEYGLADFGGNASTIVVDPTDASNTVVQSIKTAAAEVWAGTTLAEGIGFNEPFPFAPGETTMSVRVWSPTSGIQVRMKAENLTDPTVSVETEATTTVANGWQTMIFDFANEATGTAAINFASSYRKVSIFFNFGVTGGDAGEQTYYWDDVEFGGEVVEPTTVLDIIANSPDHNTLEAAVLAAELDGALSNPDATLTVFAPTDAAFATIPAGVLETLLNDPTGDLTEILLYHVLGSVVLSTDLADGQTPTTLQGDNLLVSIDGGNVMINNAMVTVVDLTADNGVVHVIDAVLVPEGIIIGVQLLDAASNNIGIYPNPSNTFFNIEFPSNPDANTDVVVYDMTGKIVRQFQIQNRLTQMDINGLTNGTYFMRINTEDASYYQKVVVVR